MLLASYRAAKLSNKTFILQMQLTSPSIHGVLRVDACSVLQKFLHGVQVAQTSCLPQQFFHVMSQSSFAFELCERDWIIRYMQLVYSTV